MKLPKRVSSGKYVDLNELVPEDVDIEDINNSLNYIYRFTGHHKDREPLTVAQHTKLVMNLCDILYPDDLVTKFDCLLHDMPEAFYGDIATPLKRKFGDQYREYANLIDDVVYKKLWIINAEFNEDIYNRRKVCDGISLDIERRIMWADQRGKDLWPDAPRFASIKEKETMFDEVANIRFINLVDEYENLLGRIYNLK